MIPTRELSRTANRVVVVAERNDMAGWLRTHGEPWDIVEAQSYLAGIAQAAAPGTRAILVGIEQGPRRLDAVVAGLRAAAGADVPIILCCRPHAEPTARRLISSGANDYLIYPPSVEELHTAIGYFGEESDVPSPVVAPSASMDELSDLAEALEGVGGDLRLVLERLAELACTAMEAQSAEVFAFGQSARKGAEISSPVLTEGLTHGGDLIGRVVLGPSMGTAYSARHAEKLRHYARLFGAILMAHHRQTQTQRQATTDPVSGLRNRRYLDQFLPHLLDRAGKQRFRVTMLMFDIDNFKRYNDTYGHTAGDEVIREIGRLMQRCCRKHDVVTRFGGDEFAVVFWDADQPRKAGSQHPSDPLTVVDRFRDALTTHHFPSLGPEARGQLTISGGLAGFPWEASGPEELIRKADGALLQAKRQGKNRVLTIGGQLRGQPAATPPPARKKAED